MKKLLLCASILALIVPSAHAITFKNTTKKDIELKLRIGDIKYKNSSLIIPAGTEKSILLAKEIKTEILNQQHGAALRGHVFIIGNNKKKHGCDVFFHFYNPQTNALLTLPEIENKTINLTEGKGYCAIQ